LNVNFSSYGQAARNFSRQFLGYLLANENIDKYSIKLEPLERDQLDLFESVHREITRLNSACVAPLVNAVPAVSLALDPNTEYIYQKGTLSDKYTFIDEGSFNNLVVQFHTHPGFARLTALFAELDEEITVEHYVSDVLEYREKFLKIGPLKSPSWFDEMRDLPADAPRRTHNLVMFAFLAIQDSLYNINQLIFQSFIQDSFTVIDRKCLVDLSSNVGNGTGRGIGALFQTVQWDFLDELLFTTSLLKIMLLNEVYGERGPALARVEASRKSLGPAQTPCYSEFRFIDENMTSFPLLLTL